MPGSNARLVGLCRRSRDQNGAFEAVVAYIQTASNPPSPGLLTSFRTGNIDFSQVPSDPSFSSNVDITFTLVPFMFDRNGALLRACWATPIGTGIVITPSSSEMTPSFVGNQDAPMTILLDDNDDDGNQTPTSSPSCCRIATTTSSASTRRS